MIIVAYFPHEADSQVKSFFRAKLAVRAKLAENECTWIEDGHVALISGAVDVDKLFGELKSVIHVFDTLLIATVSQPIAMQGLRSAELATWIDAHD
jgi:hypothetical protein